MSADGLSRYGRRKRWMRSRGLEFRNSEGRPNRPGRSPEAMAEANRRYRIKRKAIRLGITYAEAEALTPRQPFQARRITLKRDSAGHFLPSTLMGARPLRAATQPIPR